MFCCSWMSRTARAGSRVSPPCLFMNARECKGEAARCKVPRQATGKCCANGVIIGGLFTAPAALQKRCISCDDAYSAAPRAQRSRRVVTHKSIAISARSDRQCAARNFHSMTAYTHVAYLVTRPTGANVDRARTLHLHTLFD